MKSVLSRHLELPQRDWVPVKKFTVPEGEPLERCQLCNARIRHGHLMWHVERADNLIVGGTCAKHMLEQYVAEKKAAEEAAAAEAAEREAAAEAKRQIDTENLRIRMQAEDQARQDAERARIAAKVADTDGLVTPADVIPLENFLQGWGRSARGNPIKTDRGWRITVFRCKDGLYGAKISHGDTCHDTAPARTEKGAKVQAFYLARGLPAVAAPPRRGRGRHYDPIDDFAEACGGAF